MNAIKTNITELLNSRFQLETKHHSAFLEVNHTYFQSREDWSTVETIAINLNGAVLRDTEIFDEIVESDEPLEIVLNALQDELVEALACPLKCNHQYNEIFHTLEFSSGDDLLLQANVIYSDMTFHIIIIDAAN